jgi:glyceraldehyde 3-phosphate dehydrogenase
VAVECTGKFRTAESAGGHLEAGARKVVISAPGKDIDATIVMGINDETYDPAHHDVVSNASCTTNCVAPMVKVLHDAFGLTQGFMTTVHAYTGDQNLLDGPHKDLRRARSAAVNIIPTTTGAARAVSQVLPEVDGKLDGVALRVPVVTGSLVDLAVLLDREVTVAEVNAAFETASRSPQLAGRLRYEDEAFVSSDVIGESASCVFDSALTQASGRFVKVFGWYDNEWGYVCRLLELVVLVADGTRGA